ncbi:MAG TPA: metallopeptidase TldD-related protein [Halanaerobiales bacterium]|nr:metallopeptidase TldD-related protein [Halanaerobiales bacterium]
MKSIKNLKNRFEQKEYLKKKIDKLKINIENWDLQDITQENLTASSLRVIKDGKLGSNTTLGESVKVKKNLIDGAEESADYGEETDLVFSKESMDKLDPAVRENYEKADAEKIFAFITEVSDYIKNKNEDIVLNLNLNKRYEKIKIDTDNKGDLKEELVNFHFDFGAPIPGGGSTLYRSFNQEKMFDEIPKAEIDEFLAEYENTYEISTPETAKMDVLFSPRSLYFFFISLQAGISGRTIFQGTSPLMNKLDKKIFSDKINVNDKPQMKNAAGRRSFDDEGIPTSQKEIINKGLLKNYIFDLEYANKMGEKPTGNGLKRTLFGEGINTPVSPNFVNPVLEPGDKSKKDLLNSMDEGILVESVIGFHSSNYEQGHFSVQAQGFHVKNGKLQGRLQDVMIAGNIYEDFEEIKGVGDEIYPNMKGYAPYLLVNNVSVTGK